MFPLSRFKISGHSMEPTFKDGDRVVINRLVYLFSSPKTGDIVALKHPKNGDKILLKKIKKVVAGNQFFVVGENKLDSTDSRYFGKVNKGLILGKFWFRY
jgi:signal peptidase I